MRQRGVDGAGGIADDRRQVHHRVGAIERGGARVGVAHVAPDQLDVELGKRGGDWLLVVQQDVEDTDLVAGVQQLLDGKGADVAGAPGHGDLHRGEASGAA